MEAGMLKKISGRKYVSNAQRTEYLMDRMVYILPPMKTR